MINNDLTKEQLIEQMRALQERIYNLEETAAAQSQMESALSASEENLSAILEQNADGIVIVDTNGIVLYVNPATEKLFGKSKKDLLGYPFGFPVSADKAVGSLVIKKGNALCDVELRVVQVHWQKRPAFQLSVRDITERKRAEEALKESKDLLSAFANALPDIAFIIDERGLYIEVLAVPKKEKLLYTDIEKLKGRLLHEVLPKDKADLFLSTILKTIETQESQILEYMLDVQAGERHFEGRTAPLSIPGKASMVVWVSRDITERKQAEKALAEQTKLLGSFFENTLMSIAILDSDFKFVRVNESYARSDNRTPADFPGHNHFEFYPSEAKAIFEEVVATGTPYQVFGRPFVYPEHPERGTTYWDWTLVPILDETNEVKLLILSMNNVTERQKTQEALRKSEGKYRTLIEEINDGLFVMDDRGTFTFVNNALARIHGYEKPDDLIGRNFIDLTPPEDRDALLQEFSRNMQTGRDVGVIDIPIERPDKSKRYVQVHPVPIVENGRIVGARGIMRDNTERKLAEDALRKSESRYRGLFSSILDGVYETNRDGIMTIINPAGARMFGHSSPEEMVGRSVADVWADPRDLVTFLSVLKQKKSVSLYPIRIKNKKGEISHLETTSNVLVDEKGHFLGMEGILRDVTERRKLEEQLRHAQKMEAIGTLAGGVAHDFNNILNVIMGYGGMVLDKMDPGNPSREKMKEVLTAAERAATLTKQLLVFSRKEVVDVKPVNVNEIISGVQKMLIRIIGEDIDLQVAYADRRLTVLADNGQIEQVLMNLATNARDAMPKGGHLTITTETALIDDEYVAAYGYGKPGAYALIAVADTGTGMDAEMQTKIFEPFFTTKGIGEGTGLGLAISYGIIKQHNGYIKCYSEQGKGTVFKIYFPLIEDTTTSGINTETSYAIKGGTETILVGEDDPSLRKLTRIILESFGYSVITAEDGEDAVVKYRENRDRIKLVLLDLVMPKKSGKEAYEDIKKITPAAKTLFMSGYTMDMISRIELEKGMEVLRKPFAPNDLLRKAREVLDR